MKKEPSCFGNWGNVNGLCVCAAALAYDKYDLKEPSGPASMIRNHFRKLGKTFVRDRTYCAFEVPWFYWMGYRQSPFRAGPSDDAPKKVAYWARRWASD